MSAPSSLRRRARAAAFVANHSLGLVNVFLLSFKHNSCVRGVPGSVREARKASTAADSAGRGTERSAAVWWSGRKGRGAVTAKSPILGWEVQLLTARLPLECWSSVPGRRDPGTAPAARDELGHKASPAPAVITLVIAQGPSLETLLQRQNLQK